MGQAKRDETKNHTHTSTLREVKYTYTEKDDLSLEMNTSIL